MPRPDPPVSGVVVYWVAVASAAASLYYGGWACLPALAAMVVVYHGAHEVVHGTLIPKCGRWAGGRSSHAAIAGILGCALFGHNVLLVRRSHSAHHACGRLRRDCTIDASCAALGWPGVLQYYLLLGGLGCLLHELAGYLYLVTHRVPIPIRFCPRRYGRLYWITQALVFAVTCVFILRAGWAFVGTRLAFAAYWGLTQNVAHYRLEIAESALSLVAARTYRVNSLAELLLFGSVFRHLEHHAFPYLPGPTLRDPSVTALVAERLGIEPRLRHGLSAYLGDIVQQLRGPWAPPSPSSEWHA